MVQEFRGRVLRTLLKFISSTARVEVRNRFTETEFNWFTSYRIKHEQRESGKREAEEGEGSGVFCDVMGLENLYLAPLDHKSKQRYQQGV